MMRGKSLRNMPMTDSSIPAATLNGLGFARVAVISPELRVADLSFNLQRIKKALEQVASDGGQLAVFPELCITGYSCADLFYQEALLRESTTA